MPKALASIKDWENYVLVRSQLRRLRSVKEHQGLTGKTEAQRRGRQSNGRA